MTSPTPPSLLSAVIIPLPNSSDAFSATCALGSPLNLSGSGVCAVRAPVEETAGDLPRLALHFGRQQPLRMCPESSLTSCWLHILSTVWLSCPVPSPVIMALAPRSRSQILSTPISCGITNVGHLLPDADKTGFLFCWRQPFLARLIDRLLMT